MNNQRMGLMAAALSTVTMLSAPVLAEPVSPNLVMIYTDDLGYGDIGTYGASDIATPNIDAMAENGVKFTNFYTPFLGVQPLPCWYVDRALSCSSGYFPCFSQ